MSPEDTRPKNRTVVKTFRLPESLLESLVGLAKEEGTTVNALVSVVLTQYNEWGRFAKRLGVVSVSRKLLSTVLEATDNEALDMMARERLPSAWRDYAMFLYNDNSVEGVIRFAEAMARYGWADDMTVNRDGKRYVLNLKHSLGPKFSRLLYSGFDELLRTTYHLIPSLTSSDSLVTIAFTVE